MFRRYRCHAVVRNYTFTLLLSAMVVGSASKQLDHMYPCVHAEACCSCRVCGFIHLETMLLRSCAIRYGSIYMLVHIPPFKGSIFNTALAPYITSFNVITAATNILATGRAVIGLYARD